MGRTTRFAIAGRRHGSGMSISYEVLPLEGIILETWCGDITIATLRAHLDTMLRDAACLRLAKSLADVRQATVLFTDQDLRTALRDVALPLLQGRDWISAIVVQGPLQLHMASRYHALAAMFSQDAVFCQVDEAERWLLRQEQRPARPTA